MKLPEPITPEEHERYNRYQSLKEQARWARLDYIALFPKPEKPLSKYEQLADEMFDFIDANPPLPHETPSQYYQRVKPPLSPRLFGIAMRDAGYTRISTRTPLGVRKVWRLE